MTYEDYMCNQPMTDGEEITDFLDSLDEEEEDLTERVEKN